MTFNLDVAPAAIGVVLLLGALFGALIFVQINRIETMLEQLLAQKPEDHP